MLDESDVAALFGLEMAESATPDAVVPTAPKRHLRSGASGASKPQGVTKTAAKAKINPPQAMRTRSGNKKASPADATKERQPRPRYSA